MVITHLPYTRRDASVADAFHGVRIADPYRWLENPDSEETKAWVNAQNVYTQSFLKQSTIRHLLRDRMSAMYNYEKQSVPFLRPGRVFLARNTGLQNQDVLYVKRSLADLEMRVLLDPNVIRADGSASLRTYGLTEDGSLLAYGVSYSGSDWTTVKVRDVDTAQDLPDVINWVKFSGISWTHDNKGFFYSRYPVPRSLAGAAQVVSDAEDKQGAEVDVNEYHKLYYHRIGTPQEQDILVYHREDKPKWMFGAEVTDDGKYVVITTFESTARVNRLSIGNLENGVQNMRVVDVFDTFEGSWDYVANDGETFYFSTNLNAPKSRIVSFTLSDPNTIREVVPEIEYPLQRALVSNGNRLVLEYLRDAKSYVSVVELQTGRSLGDLDIPVGSVLQMSGRRDTDTLFYKFSSFITPGIVYRVDMNTMQTSLYWEPKVPGLPPASEFETKQVFYTSKDGTRVPMFIVHRKGIQLDGSHPTLLYGYGGFSISITPSFSVFRTTFITAFDGVFAVPNIRGGGEYGEEWHHAGWRDKKQNVFDDFQAAARYLIDEGYTSPQKLAIEGGSNGGLLVAACANQAPELYAAVVAHVGVMDMLRFHKFTIGHAWVTEYGCSENPEDFRTLIKYSPLHNVREIKYPSVLVLTSDHDDRVVPAHSYKYISELQYRAGRLSTSDRPLLIRIDTKAGHGAGKPTAQVIEEYADIFAFIALATHATYHP